MTKNMKRLGALLAGAVIVANMAIPSSLLAGSATKPREAGGNQSAFENPSMIGCTVCRAEFSTDAVLCTAGSGLLYWVSVDGASLVAGKGAKAFDSEAAEGVTSFNITGYAISPTVIGSPVGGSEQGNLSPWNPPAPARFENGLTLKVDDASAAAQACYRLDSGVNP